MIRLVYISSATSWPSEQELIDLLAVARSRNTRQNVTGMLLYQNATYLQVLEGDEKDVKEIFNAISFDPRNNGIVKLIEEPIQKRDFPNWSMGFQNLESIAPEELPGFSEIFQGKLDKEIAAANEKAMLRLLLQFAKRL